MQIIPDRVWFLNLTSAKLRFTDDEYLFYYFILTNQQVEHHIMKICYSQNGTLSLVLFDHSVHVVVGMYEDGTYRTVVRVKSVILLVNPSQFVITSRWCVYVHASIFVPVEKKVPTIPSQKRACCSNKILLEYQVNETSSSKIVEVMKNK